MGHLETTKKKCTNFHHKLTLFLQPNNVKEQNTVMRPTVARYNQGATSHRYLRRPRFPSNCHRRCLPQVAIARLGSPTMLVVPPFLSKLASSSEPHIGDFAGVCDFQTCRGWHSPFLQLGWGGHRRMQTCGGCCLCGCK